MGGAFPQSTHLQGRPPKPWPRGGQTGDPNQSPTMMVSRLTQQTSTEQDIKDWMGDPDDPEDKGWTFDPPTQFPSYYTDYSRVSHHWDSSPAQLEELDSYISNMMNLQELFGFKKGPARTYKKLAKTRDAYTDRAREAIRKALVHKKFKEKVMAAGNPVPRQIEQIERNEDAAINALTSLNDAIISNLEFLRGYKEELGSDPSYASILVFYESINNKLEEALYSIRKASSINEMISEYCDFVLQERRLRKRGRQAGYDIYKTEDGFIVGVRKQGNEYQAYSFEDGNYAYAPSPREAIENVLNAEELDEVSAVGGGFMGTPGQPSGQIRGHIGPLGSDNRSPKLKKKKKKKKQYEPSMKAFGGASEVD